MPFRELTLYILLKSKLSFLLETVGKLIFEYDVSMSKNVFTFLEMLLIWGWVLEHSKTRGHKMPSFVSRQHTVRLNKCKISSLTGINEMELLSHLQYFARPIMQVVCSFNKYFLRSFSVLGTILIF